MFGIRLKVFSIAKSMIDPSCRIFADDVNRAMRWRQRKKEMERKRGGATTSELKFPTWTCVIGGQDDDEYTVPVGLSPLESSSLTYNRKNPCRL